MILTLIRTKYFTKVRETKNFVILELNIFFALLSVVSVDNMEQEGKTETKQKKKMRLVKAGFHSFFNGIEVTCHPIK